MTEARNRSSSSSDNHFPPPPNASTTPNTVARLEPEVVKAQLGEVFGAGADPTGPAFLLHGDTQGLQYLPCLCRQRTREDSNQTVSREKGRDLQKQSASMFSLVTETLGN